MEEESLRTRRASFSEEGFGVEEAFRRCPELLAVSQSVAQEVSDGVGADSVGVGIPHVFGKLQLSPSAPARR